MARPRRRRRFTIAMLMGLVAVAAVWFAYDRDRLRPLRAVELALVGPDAISLGDETLSLTALTASLRRSRAERVVIVVAKDAPYSGLAAFLGAISAAGVRDIQFKRREAGSSRQRLVDMLR